MPWLIIKVILKNVQLLASKWHTKYPKLAETWNWHFSANPYFSNQSCTVYVYHILSQNNTELLCYMTPAMKEKCCKYQMTKIIRFTLFYYKRLLKNAYQCSLTSQILWLLWGRVWFLLCMKCTFLETSKTRFYKLPAARFIQKNLQFILKNQKISRI